MGNPAEKEYGLEFGVEDVEFTLEAARALYRAGFGDPNLAARWDRIREEIPFEDVVEELQGERRQVISCPFHGRDSHPSFTIYRRTNDAFCFGCPEGQKYYDSVRFVCAKWGYSRLQAMRWLEKRFGLPPLEGVVEPEEEDEEESLTISLNFSHLAEPYIAMAAASARRTCDPELASEYLAIFFTSRPGEREDPNSPESLERIMPMARVLGAKALAEIKQRGVQ